MEYCSFTFNGKNLDTLIEGYTTINVDGRSVISPNLSLTTIEGRDGDIVNSKSYPAKNITIYFLIKAKNDKEYRSILSKMNLMLITREDVQFSFGDEIGYRTGQLVAIEAPPFNVNQGIGKIVIHCQKPLRFEEMKTFSGNPIRIKLNDCIDTQLHRLSANVTSSAEVRFTNTKTGDVISLKNLELTGNLIMSNDDININGHSVVKSLDFSVSTWKKFSWKNGDLIQVVGADNVVVQIWRLMP